MESLPKMRFSADLRIEVNVDMVGHFLKMPTQQHANYWKLDIAQWGFEEEWERPLAWVMSWLDDTIDNTPFDSVPGADFGGTTTDWNNVRTSDNYRFWTEEHFDQLVHLVPWLKPYDTEPPDREDLFRIPGPKDVPLFKVKVEFGPDGNGQDVLVPNEPSAYFQQILAKSLPAEQESKMMSGRRFVALWAMVFVLTGVALAFGFYAGSRR